MGLYESLVRPMLFRLDPERAHNLGLAAIRSGLVRARASRHASLAVEAFGVRFDNPIGLAAGFDKNAVTLARWPGLGFGFVEIGTVTPRPQPGNPKPRMFRFPEDHAIINRLGFNNEGAAAVADRLRMRPKGFPVGVNLGKNKDTPDEEAAKDYAEAFRTLRGLGDYYVVNVSSPNTPGLRGLQEKGPLAEIFRALREVDSSVPLLVKIAPDLEDGAVHDVMEVAHQFSLQGIIATNTTLDRSGLSRRFDGPGGLSGKPLFERSNRILGLVANLASPEMVLIGVGGVFDVDDVRRKMDLGARLVQMYTGWVYGGPTAIPRIVNRLAER